MDTFYDVQGLTLEQSEALIWKARGVCERWWVDKLDCRESFCRQSIDMSFEEVMSRFGEKSHFVVIHRRPPIGFPDEYLEVGFRTMESPVDYFLWIVVPLERKDEVVGGLKER